MLGAPTVGAEGAGPWDRRCGAETGVVSGRVHPPSFPCSPNLRPFGSRIRAEAAQTCSGGARRGATVAGRDSVAQFLQVHRLTWLRRAHLHGRGFVLGSRFPRRQGLAFGPPTHTPAARDTGGATPSGLWGWARGAAWAATPLVSYSSFTAGRFFASESLGMPLSWVTSYLFVFTIISVGS